jgi:hypothetical protein
MRDLKASERALYKTVDLLRETEHAFSANWPVLRRHSLIRLYRLDIGSADAWYAPRTQRKG